MFFNFLFFQSLNSKIFRIIIYIDKHFCFKIWFIDVGNEAYNEVGYMKTNYVMVMLRLLNYASDKFIQKLLRLHTLGVMELCDIQYITQNTGFFFSNHSDYTWCTNMVRNNYVSCIILSNLLRWKFFSYILAKY